LDFGRLYITIPSEMNHVSRFLEDMKVLEYHRHLVCWARVHIEASAVLFPCTQVVCSILKAFPFSSMAREIDLFLYVYPHVAKPGADDAALLIGRSFLGNSSVVSKRTVYLPIAPDQDLINHIVQGCSDQPPTELNFLRFHYQDPSGTMTVTGGCNRNHEPSTVVMSWPSVKLMNLVLAVHGDGSPRALSAPVDGATLDGVAAALRDHADHSYEELSFRANEDGPLDATSLCGASLLGTAVRRAAFDGLHLSRLGTPGAMEEGPLAPLELLRFARCSFAPNARTGYCGRTIMKLVVDNCKIPFLRTERFLSRQSVLGFVIDVSHAPAVRELELFLSAMDVCAMRLLCNLLTGKECALQVLRLGREPGYGSVNMSDEGVELFFQELPSMRSLTTLTFARKAAGHLFPTVLDGLRRNYRLSSLTGLSFAYSPSVGYTREIQVYVKANAWGRGAVRSSAMSPNDPELRAAAEQAVVRSASSPDPDAGTIRFLLLRLFLPALAGCLRHAKS
jgi:hypothetical protein